VYLCIDTCCISVTTSLDFGRHAIDIDPKVLPYLGLIGNFSGLFSIMAAIFSKISFALTPLCINKFRIRILLWFIIASVGLSLGDSILIVWIQCTAAQQELELRGVSDLLELSSIYCLWSCCWRLWESRLYRRLTNLNYSLRRIHRYILYSLTVENDLELQIKKKEKVTVAFATSMGVLLDLPHTLFSFHGWHCLMWYRNNGNHKTRLCLTDGQCGLQL